MAQVFTTEAQVLALHNNIIQAQKGEANGIADLDENGNLKQLPPGMITQVELDVAKNEILTQKGAANGIATLDADQKIPSIQLPPIPPGVEVDEIGGAALFDTSVVLLDSVSEFTTVDRKGRNAFFAKSTDGRGGLFAFAPSSPALDVDNGTIFTVPGGYAVRTNVEQLNVKWFGAKGDGVTDDTAAIQAMFDHVQSSQRTTSCYFPGGTYIISSTINLPMNTGVTGGRNFEIKGYGARLKTTEPITIFSKMPTSQTQASQVISTGLIVHMFGFTFLGNLQAGQCGFRLGASYMSVLQDINFEDLEEGFVGTFCLATKLINCNAKRPLKFGFVLQSAGNDYEGNGPVWTGGQLSNSASNVSMFLGCHSSGQITRIASYCILASDAITIDNCISEGGGGLYDVYFDRQSSTTVKNFKIKNFHAEAPNVKVNLKIKASGVVEIDGLRRSYPASIIDPSGSVTPYIILKNIAYLSNLPTDRPSFYHTGGNGYLGEPTAGSSGAAYWDMRGINSQEIIDPQYWENNLLPSRHNFHMNTESQTVEFSNTRKFKTLLSNQGFALENFNLQFSPDNTRFIGASTGVRPKGIYVGDFGIRMMGKTNDDVLLGEGGTISKFGWGFLYSGTATTSNLNLTSTHFNGPALMVVNGTGSIKPMTVTGTLTPFSKVTIVHMNVLRSQILAGAGITLVFPVGMSNTAAMGGRLELTVTDNPSIVVVNGELEPLHLFSKTEKRITAASAYTAVLEDKNRYLVFNNAVTFTIPDTLFGINDEIEGDVEGGNVTLAGSGVTLSKPSTKNLVVLGSGAFKIRFKSATTAHVSGDLQTTV